MPFQIHLRDGPTRPLGEQAHQGGLADLAGSAQDQRFPVGTIQPLLETSEVMTEHGRMAVAGPMIPDGIERGAVSTLGMTKQRGVSSSPAIPASHVLAPPAWQAGAAGWPAPGERVKGRASAGSRPGASQSAAHP